MIAGIVQFLDCGPTWLMGGGCPGQVGQKPTFEIKKIITIHSTVQLGSTQNVLYILKLDSLGRSRGCFNNCNTKIPFNSLFHQFLILMCSLLDRSDAKQLFFY